MGRASRRAARSVFPRPSRDNRQRRSGVATVTSPAPDSSAPSAVDGAPSCRSSPPDHHAAEVPLCDSAVRPGRMPDVTRQPFEMRTVAMSRPGRDPDVAITKSPQCESAEERSVESSAASVTGPRRFHASPAALTVSADTRRQIDRDDRHAELFSRHRVSNSLSAAPESSPTKRDIPRTPDLAEFSSILALGSRHRMPMRQDLDIDAGSRCTS